MKKETLKKLAQTFIDKKIIGNQDQILANWADKNNRNFETASRNFEAIKQKIIRGRAKYENGI